MMMMMHHYGGRSP
jgi:hypothetical protein